MGISGLLEAIEKCGSRLEGASVADRVVGKAVALLCVYAKIRAVYAVTLSKKAKSVLEEYSVYHEWDNIVESILDSARTGICPFEKMAADTSDPKDAYGKLRNLQDSLKHRGRGTTSSEHEQFISEEDAELERVRGETQRAL